MRAVTCSPIRCSHRSSSPLSAALWAGKVNRESTYWNDVPVYQQLGLPVLTPAYWEAGFDFSSLAPAS